MIETDAERLRMVGRTDHRRPNRGFTLIELVVVLTILVILAGVAVHAVDTSYDQARYDATVRGLGEIQTAIDGDPGLRQPDGSIISNGFVADMGRLPKLVGTDPKTQLQELWSQGELPAYAIRSPVTSDTDIQLGTGWRGPYLRLPIGQSNLVDGWGNPLVVSQPMAPATGFTINSLGSDGVAGGASGDVYSADLPAPPLAFVDTPSTAPIYSVKVTGTVLQDSASTVDKVTLFQPDMSQAANHYIKLNFCDKSDEGGSNTLSVTGTQTAFTIDSVPPGLRAVRVYDSSSPAVVLATRYIFVPKGGLSGITIDLRSSTTRPSSL